MNNEIIKLISKGQIAIALQRIIIKAEQHNLPNLKNDSLLLLSRFENLKNQYNKGVISNEEYSININKISESTLVLYQDILDTKNNLIHDWKLISVYSILFLLIIFMIVKFLSNPINTIHKGEQKNVEDKIFSGRTIDQTSKFVLSDVKIKINEIDTFIKSDSQGQFFKEIHNLQHDRINVTATKEGYDTVTKILILTQPVIIALNKKSNLH